MLIVADNIQITHPALTQALTKRQPDPIQQLVQQCEAAGAQAIDINTGPLNREPVDKMKFLLESIQAVTDLPLFIDTSNPKALEAGLAIGKNKIVINGFSLEPNKLAQILPLAKEYQADIIGYLLHPDSQVPTDANGRLAVAYELFEKCIVAGVKAEQLIIDPIIAPVLWQDGNIQAMEVLTVLRSLPELLGYNVRTIAGISNLTSGPGEVPKKMLIEQAYVSMLIEAGLSMALINVFHKKTIQTIQACATLTSKQIFSWAAIDC